MRGGDGRRGCARLFIVLTLIAFGASGPAPGVAAVPKRWIPTTKDRWVYEIGRAAPRLGLCVKPWSGGRCVKPTVWVIDLYAADGVTLNTQAVRRIHRTRSRAVCYVSGGSIEEWRPDAAAFPEPIIGRALEGWPGERWIDIRQLDVLRPILTARADRCARAGFDAIDWDNADGYTQNTGFPLRADDQLTYNRMLASIAHERGLSVGLKNDLTQIPALVGSFDFAVNEQCVEFEECDLLLPFSKADKAVVQIEYTAKTGTFCATANTRRWSAMLTNRDLDGKVWQPCR